MHSPVQSGLITYFLPGAGEGVATNPKPPTLGDSWGMSSLPSGPTLPCLCWKSTERPVLKGSPQLTMVSAEVHNEHTSPPWERAGAPGEREDPLSSRMLRKCSSERQAKGAPFPYPRKSLLGCNTTEGQGWLSPAASETSHLLVRLQPHDDQGYSEVTYSS